TLDPAKALAAVIKHKGEVAVGEAIFARATCVACHTVSQDEPQKGPYLGNIFETYKRPELAEAILNPNKTIAQGFATNLIVLKDGKTQMMGFVTDEQADQVTVRDIASKEHNFKKADIEKREELPMSMMPPGLMMNSSVHEFASLLDYLERLSTKKK
ncbi:MAG: c-type cytochrome, partial [Verrucomicrobiales bacterium]